MAMRASFDGPSSSSSSRVGAREQRLDVGEELDRGRELREVGAQRVGELGDRRFEDLDQAPRAPGSRRSPSGCARLAAQRLTARRERMPAPRSRVRSRRCRPPPKELERIVLERQLERARDALGHCRAGDRLDHQDHVAGGDPLARAHEHSRTMPATGAKNAVSVFIASKIPSRAPLSTRWPGFTATSIRSAGEGARTLPPTSHSTR
jgi:hypothetical protein